MKMKNNKRYDIKYCTKEIKIEMKVEKHFYFVVIDNASGKEIYRTTSLKIPRDYSNSNTVKQKVKSFATKWLDSKFPNWKQETLAV